MEVDLKSDMKIVVGDFHAKTGTQKDTDGSAVGKFGFAQQNSRGDRIVNFCNINESYKLRVTNTMFKHNKPNSPPGKPH